MSAGSRLIRGAGELLRIPTIDIAEVGAGGGSIAWIDPAGGLQVGPRSAGADPGPACYGRGGVEPTVTDANVLLGYMPAGPVADGQISISATLAEQAVRRVAEPLGLTLVRGGERDPPDRERADDAGAAGGLVREGARPARLRADRLRRRRADPRGRARGGPRDADCPRAGDRGPLQRRRPPVRAPRVPRGANVPPRRDAVDPDAVAALFAEMEAALGRALEGRSAVEWARTADLRYGGQSWEVEVGFPAGPIDAAVLAALRARFEDEHERLYGVRDRAGSPVEIRALRLAALGESAATRPFHLDGANAPASAGDSGRRIHIGGDELDAPVRTRCVARRGARAGPAARRRVRHHRPRPARLVGPARRGHRNGCAGTERRWRLRRASTRSRSRSWATRSRRSQTRWRRRSAGPRTRPSSGTGWTSRPSSATRRDGRSRRRSACRSTSARSPPRWRRSSPTTAGASGRGTCIVLNDPFDGGMHLQDIFVFKPVHFDGELIGFTCDDRAPRRRRRPPARLERLRQHRDLPGGHPPALAAPLRGGRAGRGRLQDHRGERAHPADDVRRPRRAGRRLLGRRARPDRARRAARDGDARGPDGGADRLHRAARPAGDRDLARRHRLLHRLPRLGRGRRPRRADHRARDDRGRRDHGRPDGCVADGAGLAEQHALVRAGLRLPGGAGGADRRGAEHGRRVSPDPRPHQAGDDRRGGDARCLVDARRDGVPRRRRRQRRARPAAAGPRARRGRGRQHARDLRRRAPGWRPLHLLRAGRRHLGWNAGGRRQRRPHEPGEPRREHPGRGGRVRVPDRDRAVRARARLGRRRPAPRRPRDRACLALPHAQDVPDRPLRPGDACAVRPCRRRSRRALREPAPAPRREQRGAAADVLDRDRGGRRLRAPDCGRRRLGRSARARPRRRRRRRPEREGQPGGGARGSTASRSPTTALRRGGAR